MKTYWHKELKNRYWLSIGLLILIVGCIPKQESSKCGEGESYSTTSRKCIATVDLSTNRRPTIGANQTVTKTETAASTGFSFSINSATDDDADTLQYIVVQSPSFGTLSGCMNQSGSNSPFDTSCSYTPSDPDFVGTDFFTYRVFDGKEYSVTSATVNFVISAVDDAPIIGVVPNPVAGSSLTTTSYTINEDAGNCQSPDETGAGVPSVTATLHTLNRSYQDTGTLLCYINRTGTSAGWELYSTGDPTFTSQTFYVEEGGGSDENEQVVACRIYGSAASATAPILASAIKLQSFYTGSWVNLSGSAGSDGLGSFQQFTIDSTNNSGAVPLRIQFATQTHTNNVTNGNSDTTILVRCTDDNGAFLDTPVSDSFTVTVNAVNDPPAINLGANFTTVIGNSVTEDSAAGLSTAIAFTLDEGGGIVHAGTDDEDSQDLSFTITLSDTNLNNALTLTATDGTSIGYTLSCDSDADDDCDSADATYPFAGDTITLTPSGGLGTNVYDIAGDALITINFDMSVPLMADYYSQNAVTATFVVSDGAATTTDTFSFTINEELDPPVLANILDDSFDEDTRYSFKAGFNNVTGITVEESSNDYENHEVLWVKMSNDNVALCPSASSYIYYTDTAPDETSASPTALTGYLGVGDDTWISLGDSVNAGDAAGKLLWIFIDPTTNANSTSTGANCNVTVSLCDAANTATCDASPATYVVSDTFAMTVNQVNDIPTLSYMGGSTIADQTINASSVLEISDIVLGEGGLSDEDTDDLSVTIDSSDTSVIPENAANIKIFYRGAEFQDANLFSGLDIIGDGVGATPAAPVNLAGTDADDADSFTGVNGLRLWVKPIPGATGSSTITLTINDDNDHGAANGAQNMTVAFNVSVSNRYANHQGWDMITAKGRHVDKSSTVLAYSNPEVYISWNAFTVTNTTLSGYNLYRSDNGPNGPYVISTVTGCVGTTNTYCTDNSFTSTDAGKVFYYKVLALDGEATPGEMDTPEVEFNTVRVIVPNDNMVFVPRRIANKLICEKNNPTNNAVMAPDKYNFNRCRYEGPGNRRIGGLNYYDIDMDLMVDAFEATCPYTNNGSSCAETGGVGCIGTTNSAISCPFTTLDTTENNMKGCQTPGGALQSCRDIPGITNPRGVVSSQAEGDIYFDSVNKKCYINRGHNDWDLLPVGLITADTTAGASADVFYSRDTGVCYKADGDYSTDGIPGSTVTKWKPYAWNGGNCPYSYESTTCVGTGTSCYQTAQYCVQTTNTGAGIGCSEANGLVSDVDCDDAAVGVTDPNIAAVLGLTDSDVYEDIPTNTCWTWDASESHWVKAGDCTVNALDPAFNISNCTYGDGNGAAACISTNFNAISDPNRPFIIGQANGDIFEDTNPGGACYVFDSSVGAWYHLQVGHGDTAGVGAFADNAPDSANDVFNFNDASCYMSVGTNNHDWFAIATIGDRITDNAANRQLSVPGLPPLTFHNQAEASANCQNSGQLTYSYTESDGNGGTTTVNLSTDFNYKRLPTRAEQIAFSFWDSTLSATAEGLELGASIDSTTTFGCNSSNGGNVYFSAENYPTSGASDGIASSATSFYGMKQFLTNSAATASCQSLFGVKDHIGNVAEFTSESMTCNSDLSCGNTDYSYNNGTAFAFEGSSDTSALGPVCEDADADGNCDNQVGETSLADWVFANEEYNANFFFLPLGLPSITKTIAGSDSALEIGSTSGITSTDLRGDGISIESAVINAHAKSSDIGAVTYGGAYDGLGTNGQFSMEVIPQQSANQKTGFRCVIGIKY